MSISALNFISANGGGFAEAIAEALAVIGISDLGTGSAEASSAAADESAFANLLDQMDADATSADNTGASGNLVNITV